MITIKKPEEISLNGYLYAMDSENNVLLFDSEVTARLYLYGFGITDEEIAAAGIIFQIEEEEDE